MAIGAGLVFGVNMREIDDQIRRDFPEGRLDEYLFTKRTKFTDEPNSKNQFVKLDSDFKQKARETYNFYNNKGQLNREQLNAYIDYRGAYNETVFKVFDDYSKKLQDEYAKELQSKGVADQEEKKAALARLCENKKQQLQKEYEAELKMLRGLPMYLGDPELIIGNKLFGKRSKRTDDNVIQLAKRYNNHQEALEDISKQHQDKNSGNYSVTYDAIDSSAGKYFFNEFDDPKVEINIDFKDTADGYSFTITQKGPNNKNRPFYNDKDRLAAFELAVAHIAKRSDYRLDLEKFPKRFREKILQAWVANGRSLADVDGPNGQRELYKGIDALVKYNLTKADLDAYVNRSEADDRLLQMQISNKGGMVTLENFVGPISADERYLLDKQIRKNAGFTGKLKVQKLSANDHHPALDAKTIERINDLYQKHVLLENRMAHVQKLYDIHKQLQKAKITDNKSLQTALSQLPKKRYNKYQGYCQKYYKNQGMFENNKVIRPQAVSTPPLPDPLAYQDKDHFYRTSANKRQGFLFQTTQRLIDLLLNPHITPEDRLLAFQSLDRQASNGERNWKHQLEILAQAPLGKHKEHAFMLAQLFCQLRPGHMLDAYRGLSKERQDALFPYLPAQLQRHLDLAKAKKFAKEYNPNGNKHPDEIVIEYMLKNISPRAATAYERLSRVTPATAPLPSVQDLVLEIEHINQAKFTPSQIGHVLSDLLEDPNLHENVRLAVARNLFTNSAERAAHIITQMSPAARQILIKTINQNIQRGSISAQDYADRLVPILNQMRSPSAIKELSRYLAQDLQIAIAKHPGFTDKLNFEKFISGMYSSESQQSQAKQRAVFNAIDPTQTLAGENRKQLAFGKLAPKTQQEISEKLLKDAKTAEEFYPQKDALRALHQNWNVELNNLKAQHDQNANLITLFPHYNARCHAYFQHCSDLYFLAEKIHARKNDLDVFNMDDGQRGYLQTHNNLKRIWAKIDQLDKEIEHKSRNGIPVDQVYYEQKYTELFNELKDLDFPAQAQTELDNLDRNLQTSQKSWYQYTSELLNLCTTMKASAAGQLLEKIKAQGNGSEEFEQKAFNNFKDEVKKQVFKNLSKKAQENVIGDLGNMRLKAAFLDSLDANAAKEIFFSQARPNTDMLGWMKESHQQAIASDERLSQQDYDQFALDLNEAGKKNLLQQLHKKRKFSANVADDLELNAAEPNKPKPAPNPMPNLNSMLGGT